MPEIRKDPTSDRWVIIAPARAERPRDEFGGDPAAAARDCPFCEGREAATPGELAALRQNNTAHDEPGWTVRVVPNKFPALQIAKHSSGRLEGLHASIAGRGLHEVIVECPEHRIRVTELEHGQLNQVMEIYRQRMRAAAADPQLAAGMIFKNMGVLAGASLEHAHSQLLALPLVPELLQRELDQGRAHWETHQECLWCRLIQAELADGARIVSESAGFVALCPWAPRLPLETWIIPRRHASQFEDATDDELEQLGSLLHEVIHRIEQVSPEADPAYNYYIHSGPFDRQSGDHYHWHVEIVPRLAMTAGFEWGTGLFINPISSEVAAEALRQVTITEARQAAPRSADPTSP